MTKYTILLAVAATGSLLLTPVDRWIAFRIGAIDHPGERRVHKVPTPRLGGPAILAAVLISLAAGTMSGNFLHAAILQHAFKLVPLAIAACLVTLVGAIDDKRPLRPIVKLVVEIVAASIAVAAGYRMELLLGFHLGMLAGPLSVCCIVGVINAMNLIDGLDGLAAGLGLIISATLLVLCLMTSEVNSALLLAALCGALLGFLPYNFHPAKIFLGDSGSLLLGFLLATSAIDTTHKMASAVAILAPFLALGLPLSELLITTMRRLLGAVRVVRRRTGREQYRFRFIRRPKLFTADRNHIHHRLLASGFDHLKAVLVLYAVTAACCSMAVAIVTHEQLGRGLLLAGFGAISMAAIRGLGYEELRPLRAGLFLPLFDSNAANRRVVQALADLSFIVASYVAAYAIRFEGFTPAVRASLIGTLPIIILTQAVPFVFSRIHHRAFRYAGVADLIALLKVLALGIALGCLAMQLVPIGRAPLSVLILDAYLLTSLVLGSRLSFRVLEYLFQREGASSRRVVIYGAGHQAAAALEQIRYNSALNLRVIGFIDGDNKARGGLLHGLPIKPLADLRELIETGSIDAVVLAGQPAKDRAELTQWCRVYGIPMLSFGMDLHDGSGDEAEEIDHHGDVLPALPT